MWLFDFFKKDKNKDLEDSNDGQTLYFKNGKLYKIVGNQDDWYDPKYIVSDGKMFNLANPEHINAIPVPKFGAIDVFCSYGTKGMIDYVLRMKAGRCFERKDITICSALLWKSTELMLENKHCAWRQKDFERIVDWHIMLGMDAEAEKAKIFLERKGFDVIQKANTGKTSNQKVSAPKVTTAPKMTTAEKERAIVEMTKDSHMQMLTGFPFIWNQKIKKNLEPRTHAYCYMNISGGNINAVKNEIDFINKIIKNDSKTHPKLRNLQIPFEDLVFNESKLQGHTYFICWPITITGKISKYPLTLFFTTKLHAGSNTTHGELIYGQNGKIEKANIYFWRNGKNCFVYYKVDNDVLTISRIE